MSASPLEEKRKKKREREKNLLLIVWFCLTISFTRAWIYIENTQVLTPVSAYCSQHIR